jgi:two-component system NarL family sensor kinase
MNKFILILFQLITLSLSAQNWDSLYQVNRNFFKLVDTDLDSAAKLNQEFFKAYFNDSPDSLKLSYWETDSKVKFYIGNYENALESNLNFLGYAEQLNDTFKMFEAYIGIGTINYFTGAYIKAFQNLNKSIQLIENSSISSKFIASPCNTIGAIFNSLNNPDSAIYYYRKATNAIGADTAYTSDYLRAVINANLGALFIQKNEHSKAKGFLIEGIKFNKKINRNTGLVFCMNKLGEIYLNEEKYKKAHELFQQADSIAVFSSTLEMQKENKFSILKYYLLKENNKEGLVKLNEFNILIDSVIVNKTNENIQNAETKYQVEKKEAALKLAEEEKARLNAENKSKNGMYLLAFAGLFILILFILYFYSNSKQKAKLSALEVDVKNSELEELLANQESEVYASILKGQEQERERIAQDLHDRLGGTLAALKLALRKPQNHVEDEDLLIIDSAVNEVRSISHNLSTGLVYKYGLNEAVNQLFKTLGNSKGIKFSLYLHPEIGKLGQTLGIELYRIVQELVSNTLKHSKADEVSLQTNFSKDIFNLIYEDNGIGFDPKELKGGIGLENVNARVERIGGELNIDAAKGRGSIFIVELKNVK